MGTRQTDRIYERGGAAATNGGYLRRQGMSSRLLRALCANRGRWPGGRGEVFGSRLYEVRSVSPEGAASVRAAVEEAWADFTAAGEIADVEIQVKQTGPNQINFIALYTDLTTGEAATLDLPSIPEV